MLPDRAAHKFTLAGLSEARLFIGGKRDRLVRQSDRLDPLTRGARTWGQGFGLAAGLPPGAEPPPKGRARLQRVS